MGFNYTPAARQRWPKAAIYGSGRWAVVSCGGHSEVSLRPEEDQARMLKLVLDRDGCGSKCRSVHEIVDLDRDSGSGPGG